MDRAVWKASKILMYKEVHEFCETEPNRSRHPLYGF